MLYHLLHNRQNLSAFLQSHTSGHHRQRKYYQERALATANTTMWHPKMKRALLMQRLTCMRSMIRTPTGEPLTFSKNLNAKSGRLNWTKETGKMPVVRVPLSIKTTFASTLLEWQFASSYLKSHLRQRQCQLARRESVFDQGKQGPLSRKIEFEFLTFNFRYIVIDFVLFQLVN